MPDAIIYTRVSADEQAREGVSLDAQADRCLRYCELHGLEVAAVLREEAVSAGIPLGKRPIGAQLVARLANGDAQHVVALKLDRLFRNAADALAQTEAWAANGVALHLVDFGGQMLSTDGAVGRMFLTMLAAFAEFERMMVSERTSIALDHIALTGRKPTGLLYGYRRENGALVIDPGQAEIVREVFERATMGEAWGSIAGDLTQRAIARPRGGGWWEEKHISAMLGNAVYVGKVMWRGELLPGAHEALVSQEVWDGAQRALAARRRGAGFPGGAGFPARHLTPLLRCGFCGGRTRVKRLGGDRRLITCRDLGYRAVSHAPLNVPLAKVEAVIWRHTELLLAEGDLVAAAARLQSGWGGLSSPPSLPLHARLAEIDAALTSNLHALQRGIPWEVVEADSARLTAERAALQEQLSRCAEAVLDDVAFLEILDVRSALGALQSAPVPDRLAFLFRLYDAVHVHRDHLMFAYRSGLLPPDTRPLPAYYAPARGLCDLGF